MNQDALNHLLEARAHLIKILEISALTGRLMPDYWKPIEEMTSQLEELYLQYKPKGVIPT